MEKNRRPKRLFLGYLVRTAEMESESARQILTPRRCPGKAEAKTYKVPHWTPCPLLSFQRLRV